MNTEHWFQHFELLERLPCGRGRSHRLVADSIGGLKCSRCNRGTHALATDHRVPVPAIGSSTWASRLEYVQGPRHLSPSTGRRAPVIDPPRPRSSAPNNHLTKWGWTIAILLVLLAGCVALNGREPEDNVSQRENDAVPLTPAQSVAPDGIDSDCIAQGLESHTSVQMRCESGSVVACNEGSSGQTTHALGSLRVVCRGNAFVGVAWDSDRHQVYKRVKRMGRWVGVSVEPGRGTRLHRPPRPAPEPVVPDLPEPIDPPVLPEPPSSNEMPNYSTDNDHGYTGPRCYGPGGTYFVPC
ncbi:hypothetical protein ABFT23_01245 [Nocardioides sp. C4-1]|uniref:hypothetical protein n=1 Tax=Nocardioides sp. C4-1 TaxID=3151851 RepID=UPI003266915F